MGLIVIEFVSQNKKTGAWEYRRRVPKKAKGNLENTGFRKDLTEFKKVLGMTETEALKSYPDFHAKVERAIRHAEQTTGSLLPDAFEGLTKLEIYNLGLERVRRMGFDPFFGGVDADEPSTEAEAHARGMIADDILGGYPTDPETGGAVGVTKVDRFVIRTLNHRAPDPPDPTLEDAVKLYTAERISGTPFDIKKKTQRLVRIMKYVKEALGVPPAVNKFTRTDAKLVRDYMLELGTLKPASVKRDLNVLKALITHAITEWQLAGCMNPFNKLPIAGLDEDPEDELRDPLPDDVLEAVRDGVLTSSGNQLQHIWRLLEGTGCRLAEVTGLRTKDVVTTGGTPHIVVEWHEDRRIKTNASRRNVPLVGDALGAASEALKDAKAGEMLFPNYGKENGPGNASAALMKQVRKVTADEAHVVHSLRHNMKDRLIEAETPELTQNLILGHSLGGVGNRTYGGDPAKLREMTRAMRRAFGIEAAGKEGEA